VIFLRSRMGAWILGISTITLILGIATTVLVALNYRSDQSPETSASVTKPLLSPTSAIIVIDVQNDFLINRKYDSSTQLRYNQSPFITPGDDGSVIVQAGSVPVVNTETLAPLISSFLARSASYLPQYFFTLDWHPPGHCSYYGTAQPGVYYVPQSQFTAQQRQSRCHDDRSQRSYSYGQLVQWIPHCTGNSTGARFDPALIIPPGSVIVKKGYEPTLDSYSGMYGRESRLNTSIVDVFDDTAELWNMESTMELLNDRNVRDVVLVGVASDYCVYNTAIDALNHVQRVGGQVYIVLDLVRAVDAGVAQGRFQELAGMGVKFVNSTDFFY